MNKEIILITAPIYSLSGYGKKSFDVVASIINLYEHEYEIKIIETAWGMNPKIDSNLFDKYLVSKIDFDVKIYIHIGLPTEMKRIGEYNILITSGVETTTCSIPFINGINISDLTIVPSNFVKNVLLDSVYMSKTTNQELKVITPIEVLFEGFNQNIFKQTKSNIDLTQIKENFCFLFFGQWTSGDRKNIKGLIEVFCKTFKNKLNVPALILKTNFGNNSKIDYYKCLDEIEKVKSKCSSKNLPNIYLLHGSMSDVEVNELYNHVKVKCIVNLSHGEGFGRPTLEFNSVGKPMLLSNFSGHIDYVKSGCSPLVKGKMVQVPREALIENIIVQNSFWFDFDETDASIKMKYIFDNYKDVLKKSTENSNFVIKEFNLNKMEEKLKEIFDKNFPPKLVPLKF
jgi:hypothetical protein